MMSSKPTVLLSSITIGGIGFPLRPVEIVNRSAIHPVVTTVTLLLLLIVINIMIIIVNNISMIMIKIHHQTCLSPIQ